MNLENELFIDNFAGGGGASTGIEMATGRPITIAINHDESAILLHKTNHPETIHLQDNVWNINPKEICGNNPVGLAWFSPYYQLEKLNSRERTEFNAEHCESELLRIIKEGDWYQDDLSDEQKKRFDEFMETPYDYIGDEDCMYEHDEYCEKLKELKDATEDESDWLYRLRNIDFSESDYYSIFGREEYEMYDIGKKEPGRFFIILYKLSVVANAEKEKEHPPEKGGVQE